MNHNTNADDYLHKTVISMVNVIDFHKESNIQVTDWPLLPSADPPTSNPMEDSHTWLE